MGFFSRLIGPPSQDKFAKLILKRLRQGGIAGELHYDSVEFSIHETAGAKFFLANTYAEYCRADSERRILILNNFVRTWATSRYEIPEDFEDVKADLMPALRARSYFEVDTRRLSPDGEALDVPYQIIADSLCAALVYDLPTSMATVSQEQLDRWGVSFYEAMEIAKQNLRESTGSYAQVGTMYAMANGDAYDATRLLLTDWANGLELRGDPIAMVPNRETLLVAGSEDDEGLASMLKIAQEGLQHERYITGVALRLAGDAWQPWLPPRGHQLFGGFDMLRLQSTSQEYESQKSMLEEQYKRIGRDVFIASYSAVQQQSTGHVASYCVWSKGVPTLLPQTDLVMLAAPGADGQPGPVARGSWDDVLRIVGHLLQGEGIYPERWLAEGFPSEEEIRQLGLVPLD